MQKYRQVMADFVVHLGDRANLPLNAISGRDVRSFRDALKTTGRAATTINANVRKILSVPFLAAMKAGLLTVNPVAGVESLIDEESGERDVFTEEQIDALLEAAKGDWVGMILIGVHTALRLNDAANITWESVTLGDSALIRIQPSKTKKSGKLLTIPVEPGRLLDWLFSQPQGVGKAPVFPTLAGKGGGGKSGLSKQFKKIMERAGIVGRVLRQGKGVGRSGASLSYHCLRYTCNSAMANAGVSQEVRQEITGQSTKAINTHYTRISEPTLRDAISKISTPRGKSA
jgi:integrase